MDKIIEILERLGIQDESIILKLMILGVSIPVLLAILKYSWKGIQAFILYKNQRLLNRNLTPFFSDTDVKKATQYYVPTRFQNVSPSEDDEPGSKFIASAKQKIIPLFLKKVFRSDGDDNKFYLILADSGMGKTTFMINLFLAYKNQFTWFGLKPTHKIELLPLGSPDALGAAAMIEDKKNTILLLDAFDEDIKAVGDHKARMKDILSVAKDFREVVITCRTQFFPSEEEVPTEAGYIKTFGDGGTVYKFQKLYLSVFDDKDIKRYLRKRFSFFQFGKRKKARAIVKKSPNLVMRPMLLSYINDLVGEERKFTYTYEIYEVLIAKWIERESRKHGIADKYESSENYQKLLYKFSEELAVNLYQNKEKRGGYFINYDEPLATELRLDEVEKYEDSNKDLKGKSLLNRNAENRFKFAHKSIFEYFLAKRCIEDGNFLQTFDFDGMSATLSFYTERLVECLKNLDGTFICAFQSEKSVTNIQLSDLNSLEQLNITSLKNLDISLLSTLKNLKKLTVFDKEKLLVLYAFYSEFWENLPALQELIKRLEQQELLEMQELLKLQKLIELIRQDKVQIEPIEEEKVLALLSRLDIIYIIITPELYHLKNQQKWQEILSNTNEQLLGELKPIDDFLRKMKQLQRKLPDCEICY